MEFVHSLPESNVIFGAGKLDQIGVAASKRGSKALIVTGKSSMEKLGFLEKARSYLERKGVSSIHFNEVTPNPTTKTVDKGAKLALKEDVDLVIGFGGGSTMDTAKGIAVVAGHAPEGGSKNIWDYVSAGKEESEGITEATLPILTITTTSGTGSHVTPYSVLTNPETNGKPGFGDAPMFPDVSIVDPEILREMPPDLTAITGYDVYSHVSENLISKGDHPTADPYAKEAIKFVGKYLPRVYKDGDDMEAREMMAVADTYAGISNTISSTALRHAMEHAVSGFYPEVAHAQGLASITLPIMRYNIENGDSKVRRRYGEIARVLGAIDEIKDEKMAAEKSLEAVEALINEIDMDKGLGELGVESSSIPDMAESTFKYMEGDVEHNPVYPDKEDVEDIFEEAM